MAAKEFVNDAIAHNHIVVFSKTDCGYCKMTKEIFDKLKANYTAIELNNRDDMDDIQNALEEITGARSVPRVFISGKFIGGGSDIKKLNTSGKLVEMIK
ncbi:glutaredoxin-2, mitochondrial-like isoform X2 [Adelges cooleyi]|nr:glutaredoxin-2, mitochondrial-like isoform X2 [Adelges cooleyi]